MKFDITTLKPRLKTIGETARQIETFGFDGLWTADVAHNPFLPLTLAASTTHRIQLGTQIALAFPRSPMVTAQIAWDLAAQANGRFTLGLGTQVKVHIEKRFSTPWTEPVSRMREYIEALRAIWHTWQTGERLRYRGKHYQFRLMTPFFNPGSIENSHIPVYMAGVNTKLCRLAGETCQGLHAHAFHTQRYLSEIVLPNIEEGLTHTGRVRTDFNLVVPIFVVTGTDAETVDTSIAQTKAHIAFYASTPTYRPVMDLHGWRDTAEQLRQMARQGQWDSMGQAISDEMLHEIAIVAPPEELPARIQQRYAGIADRVCLGWEIGQGSLDFWQRIASGLKHKD